MAYSTWQSLTRKALLRTSIQADRVKVRGSYTPKKREQSYYS